MEPKDIISGLEALEERARIASRKIEQYSAFDKLQKRVWILEQELQEIKNKLQK